MKSMPRLIAAFLFLLSACAALVPPPTETAVPTETIARPTGTPSSTLTGRIVYSSEDDIFLMDLPDLRVTRLTDDPGWDFDADWSPDGRTIVFETIRDGNYEIYAVNPDDSGLRRLTDHPLEDQHPRWSPDGSAILYSHHGELYLMNPDGSDPRPLAGKPVTGNFAEWRTCLNES